MNNLWEELDDDQKQQLIDAALEGRAKTPENMNRVREQFATNPEYTNKFAREAGLEVEGAEVGNSVEDNVDAALADEGDVATAGQSKLPPPEEGEDIQDYYRRLSDSVGEFENNRPQETRSLRTPTASNTLNLRAGFDKRGEPPSPEEMTRRSMRR